jgi:Uncharacterized conserved protein
MQSDNKRFRTTHAVIHTGDGVKNAREAARLIRGDLAAFPASLVIYFSSADYDADVLAREMQDAFPSALTMGCTTAGEAVDGLILNCSVVAMAFSAEVFDYCESALVTDGSAGATGRDVFGSVADAMDYIGRGAEGNWIDLDHRRHIGFMLGDSISAFSERVLDQVGEMTDVLFIGGFSGDDLKFDGSQRVMYRGKAYRNAAVLSLWKPRNGFAILKTQAAELNGPNMVITRADEANRILWELDGEDAAAAYARVIGRPQETMNILDFDEHPLAFMVDGEPFLQAVLQQVDGKGLRMFASIRQGTRRTVTTAGDVLETTRRALADKLRETGDISAILHINCSSRHTALKNRNQLEGFAALFGDVPSVAMSSYGEIYVGPIAETSTMILFK